MFWSIFMLSYILIRGILVIVARSYFDHHFVPVSSRKVSAAMSILAATLSLIVAIVTT